MPKSQITELLHLADRLDSKGLTIEANLIDKAWFDSKVMDRSVERNPLFRFRSEREPVEKNYCFNCQAPVPTLESKCEVCGYEPVKKNPV